MGLTRKQIVIGAVLSLAAVLIIAGIVVMTFESDDNNDTIADNDGPPTRQPPQVKQRPNNGGSKAVTKRPPQIKTPPPAADEAGSVSTLPAPSRLTLDYSQNGQISLRQDGNLQVSGKNIPFNFGERPSTAGQRPGDRTVVIAEPNAIGTDSTACKASQVEYRRRVDGRIEIVTRGCTRITRWE